MNRREFIQAGTFLVSIQGRAAQSAPPAPLLESYFPSRLHAFVWRNWELTNTNRMAEVVRCPPEEIIAIGESLGLPPKPHLTDDQLRRIYITIIRQNWHLLPESQIIQLLEWTPEKFAFTLKEDDFLDIKLGKLKPKWDELIYHAPTAEEKRKSQWARRTVQENFGSALTQPGEEPMQFVHELSTFRYALARNENAAATSNDVDLSSGWSIVTEEEFLRSAAGRFSRYMSEAMDARIPVDASSEKRIEIVSGDHSLAEGAFRVDVGASHVRIAARDNAGILESLYWLEDCIEQREAPFLPIGSTTKHVAWNPRFLYSYFALYGDPLMETETDPFPDAYLERLARSGMNGVWIQGVLNTLAPSKVFPEFGTGSETRLKNLDVLVNRAAQFGVKVYVYFNEPRAMPPAFFRNHPEMRGSSYGGLNAICSSVPAVRDWIAGSLSHIAQRVPDLGGMFCITMSENHTNCFSQGGAWGKGAPNAGDCPRCSKRNSWDVIAELIRTFRDGIRAGGSKADVMAWDWGWGDELTRNLLPLLPHDVRFLSVSEWDKPVHRGGVNTKVGEYSMSVVGPGPRAVRNWELSRASGLQPMAKTQFNNTWEISAVPYIPVTQLVLEHCENLTREKISGVLASWTCGGYPSPNLAAAKAYFYDSPPSRGEVALSAARQRYGDAAAADMTQAWQQFSTAFQEFPYGVAIYTIPTQHGPANLLRLKPTGYKAGMMLFPYDDYRTWAGAYPVETVQLQFAKMARLWNEGLKTFDSGLKRVSPRKMEAARQDFAIARTCYLHFQSVANQVEFYRLRDSAAKTAQTRSRMREIAREETHLAREQFMIAKKHSVIGYEASNHYYYRPLDLVEKVLNCQSIIDELDTRMPG